MGPPRVVLVVFLWSLEQVLNLSSWRFNYQTKTNMKTSYLSILFVTIKMIIIERLYLSSKMFRTVEMVNVQVRVWRGKLQVVSLAFEATQDYRHQSLMRTGSSLILLLPWSMRSTTAFRWCILNRGRSQMQGRTCSPTDQDNPSWSGLHKPGSCYTFSLIIKFFFGMRGRGGIVGDSLKMGLAMSTFCHTAPTHPHRDASSTCNTSKWSF